MFCLLQIPVFLFLSLAEFKKLFWFLRNVTIWEDLQFAFFKKSVTYLGLVPVTVQLKHINSCILSPFFSLIPCSFWNWNSLNSYIQVPLNFEESWSLAFLTVVAWPLNPRSEKTRAFGKLWCKLNFTAQWVLPLHPLNLIRIWLKYMFFTFISCKYTLGTCWLLSLLSKICLFFSPWCDSLLVLQCFTTEICTL